MGRTKKKDNIEFNEEEESDNSNFSPNKLKPILSDLFTPKPYIYWTDFFGSISIGWFSFYQCYTTDDLTWKGIFFILAVLGLYRSLIFTHELSHLKRGTFGVFRWVWNFLCGFPLQIPSFLYHGVHNDHHIKGLYGTDKDGEYLPFGADPQWKIFAFFFFIIFSPIFFLNRFLILSPLSIIFPRVRKFAWQHASSLSVDIQYTRPAPLDHYKTSFLIQEVLTSLYSWSAVILILLKVVSPMLLVYWYFVAVCISYLNGFRTLAAHRYRNGKNEQMSFLNQFLDSVNVLGNPITTALWAPVGLRFHGLHHFFPTMPYHSFREAHNRLSRELPPDSCYWQTVEPGLFSALRRLMADARASQKVKS